jgi:hypothetical protein
MALLVMGGAVLAAAIILDFFFRERMAQKGQWAPLFQGGIFNYAEYHRIRVAHGWAAWPVYVMWALYVCGIGLLIAGFSVHFGTQPHHSS